MGMLLIAVSDLLAVFSAVLATRGTGIVPAWGANSLVQPETQDTAFILITIFAAGVLFFTGLTLILKKDKKLSE
jgi:hypothetical protein